jgi:hypothetical protein
MAKIGKETAAVYFKKATNLALLAFVGQGESYSSHALVRDYSLKSHLPIYADLCFRRITAKSNAL